MSLASRFQTASSDFQKLQGKLTKTVEARQKLEAQLSENELVKKEFAKLSPENTIYKQIGPVLVKQDILEAKTNVDTRLEFIKSEIIRVEKQIQETQEREEKSRQELVEIQTAIEQQNAQETGARKIS